MSDLISRQDAIDATCAETVSTNPEHFKSSKKFIEFMDDIDISDFGRWQWANGFNTALVATKIQLENLPSVEPEIIMCKDCKHHHYEKDIPYCDRINYGYGWKDNDYCSRAERRKND